MSKYVGVLNPIEDNSSDGRYPQRWRDFYIDAGSVLVWVEARTGGERDKLLTMKGEAVEIEGGKPVGTGSTKLSCGDPATIKLIETGPRGQTNPHNAKSLLQALKS